jgi:hypothetical protein
MLCVTSVSQRCTVQLQHLRPQEQHSGGRFTLLDLAMQFHRNGNHMAGGAGLELEAMHRTWCWCGWIFNWCLPLRASMVSTCSSGPARRGDSP